MNFFKKLFGKNKASHDCCGGSGADTNSVDFGLSDDSLKIIKSIDEKIVVGKIIEKRDHQDPKMTKVKVCQVDFGTDKKQILCGGTNTYEGQIVVVAMVGAKLSEDFEISEREIRGELSSGMICARSELGITDTQEEKGEIWELPKSLEGKLGTALNQL